MADLVERLGGAIVSPHSQSGTMCCTWSACLKKGVNCNLVKGIIIPESAIGTQLREHGNHTAGLRSHTVPAHERRLPYRALHGMAIVL